MDLTVLDKIDFVKAEYVAKELGVSKDVFMDWLIDEKMPKSYIEKMAKLFNRPFENYVKGPYVPPQYKRNRERWERT